MNISPLTLEADIANKFPDDNFEELDLIKTLALNANADAAEISDVYSLGGDGAISLAESLINVSNNKPDIKSDFNAIFCSCRIENFYMPRVIVVF